MEAASRAPLRPMHRIGSGFPQSRHWTVSLRRPAVPFLDGAAPAGGLIRLSGKRERSPNLRRVVPEQNSEPPQPPLVEADRGAGTELQGLPRLLVIEAEDCAGKLRLSLRNVRTV